MTGEAVSVPDRIVTVATRLFATKGYHATGVAELGREVGLGAGALYYHIGSKEDLLYTICRVHVEDTVAFGNELLAEPHDPITALHLMARHHLDMIAHRRLELLVTWRDIRSLTGHRYDEIVARRDEVEHIWYELIQRGVQEGALRPVDDVFVKTVIGAINYSILWYVQSGRLSPDQVADRIIDSLLQANVQRVPQEAPPANGSRRRSKGSTALST